VAEAVATISDAKAQPFVLKRFHPNFGEEVASWVRSPAELKWIAPSCTPPITPSMVRNWVKINGRALILARAGDHPPIGYGELNPLRDHPRELWIGHVVLKPSVRGRGLGEHFTRLLLTHAFDEMNAERVSLVVFPQNARAVACYQRAGLRAVAEEFHQLGPGPKHRLIRMEAKPPPA
jgi:RimJ/RimL family protein N-acetyltransferase